MKEKRHTALVLSGGGAKGAFQVGVLQELRKAGYTFDVISGVSVGSLNGAMMATGQFDEMVEIWKRLTPRQVLLERSLLGLARRYIAYKIGLAAPPVSKFDNRPLQDMLNRHLLEKEITVPLYFGMVRLETGEYVRVVLPDSDGYAIKEMDIRRILASTAIPVAFPPVPIGNDHFVDGGLRDISPIREVLPHNPERMVLIPTSPIDADPERVEERDIIGIAFQAISIMLDEIFREDIDRFLSINDMVRQAEAQGVELKRSNGLPYRYIDPLVLAPEESLGSPLNFDNKNVSRLLEMGRARARDVLNQQIQPV